MEQKNDLAEENTKLGVVVICFQERYLACKILSCLPVVVNENQPV